LLSRAESRLVQEECVLKRRRGMCCALRRAIPQRAPRTRCKIQTSCGRWNVHGRT